MSVADGKLDLSPLFEPFDLKGLSMSNRFVMPGMQRQWCENGRPLPRLGHYYRRRVEGGVSLVISESCAIDHPTSTQTPLFARINEDTADAWAACIAGVKSAGGNMFMQLWHEGAMRVEGGEGPHSKYPSLSPSGLAHRGKQNGRAATLDELAEVRDAFVRSAVLAKQAGVDGVEIHGAHGFFLDQFLWADTNRRDDGYGGDEMAARVRYPAEVVAAVRAAVGLDFVISFRFSQWKEADYEAQVAPRPEDLAVMVGTLRAAGVDVFHASARRFWIPEWPGSDLCIAGWTKSMTDAPVIAVGSVGLDTDVMDSFTGKQATATGESGFRELLRRFLNGEFDLVSVGRSHIADPDFVHKVREGRLDEIRTFTKADLLGAHEFEGIAAEAHR